MIIKVKVKPNSGRQEIVKDNKGYKVYLKSAPEDNRANMELIRLLERNFKKQVKIKTGLTSRRKTLELK